MTLPEDLATKVAPAVTAVVTCAGFFAVAADTTEAIQQPDLGLAIAAFGEECEEFAVRAPTGVGGGEAFGGHGERRR